MEDPSQFHQNNKSPDGNNNDSFIQKLQKFFERDYTTVWIRFKKMEESGDANPPMQVNWPLHLGLFFLTFATCSFFSASFFQFMGVFIIPYLDETMINYFYDNWKAILWEGFTFGSLFMTIITCHEMGHYLTGRYYNIQQSPPYFIPLPFLIGTMGAIIRMKGLPMDKSSILKVGAAGPIAGFIVTVIVLLVGYQEAEVISKSDIPEGALYFGDSLFTLLLEKIYFPNLTAEQTITLPHYAFAGWFGLLITGINLFPIGQLDGGHVSYAMFGKDHKIIGYLFLILLVAVSFIFTAYLAFVLFIIFFVKINHPPTLHEERPISRNDRLLGIAALVVFLLSFMPQPFIIE